MKKILFLLITVASVLFFGAVVSSAPVDDTTTTDVPVITAITDDGATVSVGAAPVPTTDDGRVQVPITQPVPDISEPLTQTLPETGFTMRTWGFILVGLSLLGLGWLLVQWARDE